jgi:hypothetical protein
LIFLVATFWDKIGHMGHEQAAVAAK